MILFNIRRKNVSGGSVSRRDISESSVTLSAQSFPYTGAAITPGVVVTYGGRALEANVDYVVECTDNTEIGQATVTVSGIGDYFGSKSARFYITSADPGPEGWGFNIGLLGAPVASGAPSDGYTSMAVRCASVLDDGRILYVRNTSGTCYGVICGFASGHYFEVESFSSPTVTNAGGNVSSILMKPDGSACMMVPSSYNYWYSYSLSAPFDMSVKTQTAEANRGNYKSALCSESGKRILLYSETNLIIYTASSGYTANAVSSSYSQYYSTGYTISAIAVSRDGKFIVTSEATQNGNVFRKYSLSTAWDLSNITLEGTSSPVDSSESGDFTAIAINDSGTKMLAFGKTSKLFYEFNLSR